MSQRHIISVSSVNSCATLAATSRGSRDVDADGTRRRPEGYGRIRDSPLQLRMRTEAKSNIVPHDAVVQHTRLSRGIQSDRDVADSGPFPLGWPKQTIEQIAMLSR